MGTVPVILITIIIIIMITIIIIERGEVMFIENKQGRPDSRQQDKWL